jgi:hypothetical protein
METVIIVLQGLILGCLIHLERKTSAMGVQVTVLWKKVVNGENDPRPRKRRGRGLDKNKSGG